jgi:DNA-directed RNA polymerase specialized sigma24 family protein
VFYEQIKTYYETDVIPDILAQSVYKIAVGLSYAPNFINYSYKDEMVGDAVLKMFSALQNKKFNCDTGNNPFSYFTTIAFHAFINRIKKEKKHRETIVKYQETVYNQMIEDNGGVPLYTESSDELKSSDE